MTGQEPSAYAKASAFAIASAFADASAYANATADKPADKSGIGQRPTINTQRPSALPAVPYDEEL